jgi:hypothetical protein
MKEEEFLGQLSQMTVDQLIAAYQTATSLVKTTEVQLRASQIIELMQQHIYDNCGEGINRFTMVTGGPFRSYGENMCESM